MLKKVSVIIPARNEQEFIQRAVEKYKSQDYPVEVIVVANDSQDKTYELAKGKADKVLNFPNKIGVSAARNEGAKAASGDVFIFSDADSYLPEGAVRKIVEKLDDNTIGAPLGRQDEGGIKGWLFFLFKNWTHRLRIYRGVIDGILFCDRKVFTKISGFNEKKRISEFDDFINRAKAVVVKYRLFTNFYATTSLRRYRKNGYFKSFLFWIHWRIAYIFNDEKELTEKYFRQ